MDFKVVKSSDYLKGLKFSMMPKHLIDTIKGHYITNELAEDAQLASVSLKNCKIGDSEVSLPVNKYTDPTVTNSGINSASYLDTESSKTIQAAKIYVGATFATVECTLKSDKPVVSNARIVVSLTGEEYQTEHNETTYDDTPTSLTDAVNALASKEASTFTGNSDNINYESGKVVVVPCLKEEVANNAQAASDQINLQWDCETTHPQYGQTEEAMDPSGWQTHTGTIRYAKSIYNTHAIKYDYKEQVFIQEFTQIDQYRFKVVLKLPVKMIYTGATRKIHWDSYTDPATQQWETRVRAGELLDSKIFMNLLKEVTVTLYGVSVNVDDIPFAYSLNGRQLTTDLVNMNIFQFTKSEFITQRTYWNSISWIESVAKYILETYKEGKYLIEFEMYYTKALQKDLKINELIKVFDLHNVPFKRNTRDILFEVKNIEKTFRNNSFVYLIKAIEKSSTLVDTFTASLVYNFSNSFGEAASNKYISIRESDELMQASTSLAYSTRLPLGYAITKTSRTSRVSQNFILPGNYIGNNFCIILRIRGSETINLAKVGLVDMSNGDTYEDSDCLVKTEGSDQLVVGIVSLESEAYLFSCYAFVSNYADNTQFAVGVYNLNNNVSTKEETLSWIKQNSKLPQF